MESHYTRKMLTPASACDWSGRLGLTGCAELFMDIATDHAEIMGLGLKAPVMKDRFWVTAKTRIDFYSHPFVADEIEVTTWPEVPERVRCIRNYRIEYKGETAVLGKTQWVVTNIKTGMLENVREIYPEDLVLGEDHAIDEPFARVKDDPQGEVIGEYRVLSADIDLGGHMNNTKYLRAFESLYTVEQLKTNLYRSVEIHYRRSCFEGQTLVFRKSACDSGEGYTAYVDSDPVVSIVVRR